MSEFFDDVSPEDAFFFGFGMGFADELSQENKNTNIEQETISVKDYKYDNTTYTSRPVEPSSLNIYVSESIREAIGDNPTFMKDVYKKFECAREKIDRLKSNLKIIGISYDTFLDKLIPEGKFEAHKFGIATDIQILLPNIANDLAKLTQVAIEAGYYDFKAILLSNKNIATTPQIMRLKEHIHKWE